jgi:carboxyl-terminal processing protease
MRGTLVVGALFLGAANLLAVSDWVETPVAVRPLDPQEARTYAIGLADIVQRVSVQYVRPIPRHQLYFAALSGLYEAAGQPVPERLQGDLAEAFVDLPELVGPPEQLVPVPPPEDEPFRQAIAAIAPLRQQLGDCEALKGMAALRVSVQAITRLLDPYSAVVDSRELRRSTGEDVHRGLGIEIGDDNVTGPLKITSVALGSPAQRAGVRPGDRITHVDSKVVDDSNRASLKVHLTYQASASPPGEAAVPQVSGLGVRLDANVNLTVVSLETHSQRTVTLRGQDFTPERAVGVRRDDDERWNYLLDRDSKIGYIRIGSLDHGTADDVAQALERLHSEKMRGLILDLRWSPGGFLNEAVLIARLFLKDGVVATVRSRNRDDDQTYKSEANAAAGQFPMIVLVNGETMGGAELIAAALQDHKRARVAGERTFGKASVQTLLPLPALGMAFRLTTGDFHRPNGKPLHRYADSQTKDDWGVQPEAELTLPLTADLSKQLQQEWLLYSLRPSTSAEALLLDDPEKDAQRQLAVTALREMLK